MLQNSPERFGVLSKSLHWGIAALVAGLTWLGWYMVDLTYYDRWYNASLEAHKALGLLVLALAALNLGWRWWSPPPGHVPDLRPWERVGAAVVHWLLFAALFAIPLSGYVVSTSEGGGVSIFGWFDVPALHAVSEGTRDLAIDVHYYAAYATACLAAGHALAALKHHFVDGDATLRRML